LFGLEKRRRLGDRDYRVDTVVVRGNAAAATFSWTTGTGDRVTWGQALILRDGRIVHMQDFTNPAKALKAARP
jgi:ketosteroid isomerase-like protein